MKYQMKPLYDGSWMLQEGVITRIQDGVETVAWTSVSVVADEAAAQVAIASLRRGVIEIIPAQ